MYKKEQFSMRLTGASVPVSLAAMTCVYVVVVVVDALTVKEEQQCEYFYDRALSTVRMMYKRDITMLQFSPTTKCL